MHVGVVEPDMGSAFNQCQRQVETDGGFPNPALTAAYSNDEPSRRLVR